jgi:TatD DNase family protein
MTYFDIHTHKKTEDSDTIAIESFSIGTIPLPSDRLISVGLHPWYIEDDYISRLSTLEEIVTRQNVAAIGETGLDKLAKAPMELQKEVFLRQAKIAEETKKPLIIHCVKAWSELLEARRIILPSQPWIVHGFRGNGQLASQLLSKGISMSFERYYNEDALRTAFSHCSLLETDDSDISIHKIYLNASRTLSISLEELEKRTEESFDRYFNHK